MSLLHSISSSCMPKLSHQERYDDQAQTFVEGIDYRYDGFVTIIPTVVVLVIIGTDIVWNPRGLKIIVVLIWCFGLNLISHRITFFIRVSNPNHKADQQYCKGRNQQSFHLCVLQFNSGRVALQRGKDRN